MTGATVADLAGLVDKSWLRLRDTGRYTMHELARQYCEEKLDALRGQAGEDSPEEVRRRHCTYYGIYVRSIVGSVNYRPAALGEILAEYNNLLGALHAAVEFLDVETAYSIVTTVFFAGDMMGWLHFTIQILDTVASVLENRLVDLELVEPQRTEVANVLAVIRHAQFSQNSQLGLFKEAAHYGERQQSLINTMQPGRAPTYWRAWMNAQQADYAFECGDFNAARWIAREALETFQAEAYDCYLYGKERGVAYWQSGVHHKLGRAAWALGEYATSEENLARCMALRDAMGEQRFKGMHLSFYAQLAQTTGDYARAEELARQGLRLSETCGDRISTALGHRSVGSILAVQGRGDAARRHLFKSLETGRHSGRLDLVIRSLCELGRIDLAQGRPVDAKHRFRDAYAAFERAGVEHHNALTGVWLGLGWAALAEEDACEARRMFDKAHEQRGAAAFEVQESEAGLAHVLRLEGQHAQAAVLLQQVIAHTATAHATRMLALRAVDEMAHESPRIAADSDVIESVNP